MYLFKKNTLKIFLVLIFSIFCAKPQVKNSCDPKSETFKIFVALRTLIGSSYTFCNFRVSSSSNLDLISTDFSELTNQAPVVVSKSQVLGFTFSAQMEKTGCGLKFQSTKNDQISFSVPATATASTDEKTLFLKPNTFWPTNIYDGYLVEILPTCKSKSGDSFTKSLGLKIYISDLLVYVDTKGSDSNLGTITNPVATFAKAIELVSANCNSSLSCSVAVKSGEYIISSPIIFSPPSISNLSIFGGFESGDWKKRKADKTMQPGFDTILTDSSSNVTDNTSANPYMPLKYLGTNGSFDKNIIDGLIINGPISGASTETIAVLGVVDLQANAGVVIRNTITKDRATGNTNVTSAGFMSGNNSGKIELTNCSFSGSSLAAGTGSARQGLVYFGSVTGSELSLSNSILEGGVSATVAAGIFFSSTVNGTINVSENTITSGVGQSSTGITAQNNGTITVSKNRITALDSTSQNSSAITVVGSMNLIADNNTITSGNTTTAGAHSFGINFNSTGTSTITNNTISTGSSNSTTSYSAGIHINAMGPLTLTNNKINAGTAAGSGTHGSIGIVINSNANTTLNSNTITSGMCTSVSCVSSAIFQIQLAVVNGSGNILTGGSCNASSCTSAGYFISGASTNSSNINMNTSTIKGGDCTFSGCVSFGFFALNSDNSSFNFSNNQMISGGSSVNRSSGIELSSTNTTNIYSGNQVTSGSCTGNNCETFGMNLSFGTNFTLTNNTVSAGTCLGSTCSAQTGIRYAVNGSLLVIEGNTVDSGNPGLNSTPIALDLFNWPDAASTSIQRNTFISKDGAYTNGFTVRVGAQSKQIKFCSNVINGGTKTNSGGTTVGLEVAATAGSGARSYMANTIIPSAITGGLSYGFRFISNLAYTNLKLDQNIIYGNPSSAATTTCIEETGATVTFTTLTKNSLNNCTSYNENGSIRNFYCAGNYGVLGCATQLTNPSGVNNIDSAFVPIFTSFSTSNFRLTGPTQFTTAMAGADLTVFNTSCGNFLDRDGQTRLANSSIGAYR